MARLDRSARQRQLVLLRDMLNNVESTPDDANPMEDMGVNQHWRCGDAMSSTVTAAFGRFSTWIDGRQEAGDV